MKNVLTFVTIFALSVETYADVFAKFRNEDGSTKWQYVANFSSSVLILTLLIVTIFLFFAHRRAARSNRELTEIKASLEDRVERRTASLQETTAHLQSREAYIASIVNSMPIMLIGLNHNMEVIQWNNVAEKITGRPITAVLGKKLWDAYPAIALTPEQVTGVLKNKETLVIKHSQRSQYYFDITLYALTDNDETGIIILVDDITKQVKAETKLAARDKMSAMGELASAMAYDINLPLQSILTTLINAQEQLTHSPHNKESLLPQLSSAQQSSQQATAIIQNLLGLANSHHDEKQLVDITQVMNDSIALAGNLFADTTGLNFNHINVICNYAPALPATPCFAAEIQQVFIRVLRNSFHALNAAIKNHAAIVPAIRIDISEFYDTLWIKIQHNGKSLSPEEQRDIFLPFFSNTSNPPACPVEQRLSYSFYIITDHHQGQMSVTSDEKFGTSFNIQLPLT